MGLLTPGQLGLAVRLTVLVRIWGKSLPSLPAWVGAPRRVVVVVVADGAPGVCSVLRALEGGEGSIEAVRSGTCCGLADAARGGLYHILVRPKHWNSDCKRGSHLHRLCFHAFRSLSCDLNVLCSHVD